MSALLRSAAPIHLVIIFVGLVLLLTVIGIIGLAYVGTPVPDVLGTVCIASLTGLSALLTPHGAAPGNVGDRRTDRRAAVAGQAAAMAVVEHDGIARVHRDAIDDNAI